MRKSEYTAHQKAADLAKGQPFILTKCWEMLRCLNKEKEEEWIKRPVLPSTQKMLDYAEWWIVNRMETLERENNELRKRLSRYEEVS